MASHSSETRALEIPLKIPLKVQVFATHPALYALPLAVRFAAAPFLATHALTIIAAVFGASPTLGDASLALALAVLHFDRDPSEPKAPVSSSNAAAAHCDDVYDAALALRDVRQWRRSQLVALGIVLGLAASLLGVTRRIWLETGTGNANHFFFQSLIYTGSLAVAISVCISTALAALKARRRVGTPPHPSDGDSSATPAR